MRRPFRRGVNGGCRRPVPGCGGQGCGAEAVGLGQGLQPCSVTHACPPAGASPLRAQRPHPQNGEGSSRLADVYPLERAPGTPRWLVSCSCVPAPEERRSGVGVVAGLTQWRGQGAAEARELDSG